MMLPVVLMAVAGIVSVYAEPPVYPQVRFQPLQNVVVLPSNAQLNDVNNNATKQQDAKPKDIKPEEGRTVTMEELRTVEGAVTGSYHVLLENGQLQRVDYTAAPRLPIKEQINQEPEIRSWYYTQFPADVLQRYYAEYYAQQENSQYRKPGSTNQASNSNSQGFSQSAGHGTNQVSSNNNQVFNQGKKGAFIVPSSSHQSSQRTEVPTQSSEQTFHSESNQIPSSSNQNSQTSTQFNSQQSFRSNNEVETFQPVQKRTQQHVQQSAPPSDIKATIYFSDVNPITGPVYSFDQAPLIRVLRKA